MSTAIIAPISVPVDRVPSVAEFDAALGPDLVRLLEEHEAVLSDFARLRLSEWKESEAKRHVLAAVGERVDALRAVLTLGLRMRREAAERAEARTAS